MMEGDNEPCYRCNLLAVMSKLERIKRNALKEEQAAQRNHYQNSSSTKQNYGNHNGKSSLYSPSQSSVMTTNMSSPQIIRRPVTTGTSSPMKLPKFHPKTGSLKDPKVRSAPMNKVTKNVHNNSEIAFIHGDVSYDSRSSTAPTPGKRDDRSGYSVTSGGTTNMFPDTTIPLGGSPSSQSASTKREKLLTNVNNFVSMADKNSKDNEGIEPLDQISPMIVSPDMHSLAEGSVDSIEAFSLLTNPTKGGEGFRPKTSPASVEMNFRTTRARSPSSRSRSGY